MDVFGDPHAVEGREDGADESKSEGADDGGFDVKVHLEGVDEDDGEGDVDDFEDGVEGDDEGPAEELSISPSISQILLTIHRSTSPLHIPSQGTSPAHTESYAVHNPH